MILLLIVLACVLGLLYGLYNYYTVYSIAMVKGGKEAEDNDEEFEGEEERSKRTFADLEYKKLVMAGDNISENATVYLLQEYGFLGVFVLVFGAFIYVFYILYLM